MVSHSDNFVERKLKLADKIVLLKVVDVVKVVHIVNHDFVHLTLLKVILHVKLLDPLGRQTILNHFSLPYFLPGLILFAK